MALNLSALGLELDNVRRARRGEPETTGISPPSAGIHQHDPDMDTDEVDAPSSPHASTDTSPETSPHLASGPPPQENPYPLCLLCFTRVPSAVLLPCAHLNLCYLCAPLLMHKSRSCALPSAAEDPAAAAEQLDPRRDGRVPFNVALSRAMASRSPNASSGSRRRLSIGGYVPPKEGNRGGELRGRDLLPGAGEDESVGLSRQLDEHGQVRVAISGAQAAQCLVCRQGVTGWLRVYSG